MEAGLSLEVLILSADTRTGEEKGGGWKEGEGGGGGGKRMGKGGGEKELIGRGK